MKATEKYGRLLRELREGGGAERLLDALDVLPEAVEEVIRENLSGVKVLLDEMLWEVEAIKGLAEKLANSMKRLEKEYAELNNRLLSVEEAAGGLAEAMLSRLAQGELESRGYRVKATRRNYTVDGEHIDLLIVAEKGGVEEHFIAEVRVKPSHPDVGSLLAKADLYKLKTNIKPKPILAGVRINSEVEVYAKAKGVEILKL